MSFQNHPTRLDYELSNRGLSATWLAAQLDCSAETVTNYRMGLTMPRADVALKIANLFGLTVEEIIQKFETAKAA
jgi:predicted transcriptional regulator